MQVLSYVFPSAPHTGLMSKVQTQSGSVNPDAAVVLARSAAVHGPSRTMRASANHTIMVK